MNPTPTIRLLPVDPTIAEVPDTADTSFWKAVSR